MRYHIVGNLCGWIFCNNCGRNNFHSSKFCGPYTNLIVNAICKTVNFSAVQQLAKSLTCLSCSCVNKTFGSLSCKKNYPPQESFVPVCWQQNDKRWLAGLNLSHAFPSFYSSSILTPWNTVYQLTQAPMNQQQSHWDRVMYFSRAICSLIVWSPQSWSVNRWIQPCYWCV